MCLERTHHPSFHRLLFAKALQGLDRAQADVHARIVGQRVEERGHDLCVGLVELFGPPDTLETLARGPLLEQ